jgi:hypothetical protein
VGNVAAAPLMEVDGALLIASYELDLAQELVDDQDA